jgi:beta-glucosidase/6-phospho-beta-glucosidase/beta-galactosidase
MSDKKLISFQVTLEQDEQLKIKAREAGMGVSAYLRWCGLDKEIPIKDVIRIEYSDDQKCFHFCTIEEKMVQGWEVIGFLPFSKAIKFTHPLKTEKRESVECVKMKFAEFVGR